MPVFEVTDPNTGITLELTGETPPNEQELNQIFSSLPQQGQQFNANQLQQAQQISAEPQPQNNDFRQQINDFILSAPGGPEVAEFGAAVSRGATDLADFFTTKPVNAALNLVGSNSRLPELTDKASAATTGNFLENGLKKDIIRGAGEAIPGAVAFGGALRQAASLIPKAAESAANVGANIIKQLGATTAAQDAGFAAISGAGSEVGRATEIPGGEVIGAFLAPVAALTTATAAKKGTGTVINAIKNGKTGIKALLTPAKGISKNGAKTLLAEAMVREGITPQEAEAAFKSLGPDAIPADLGIAFSKLLREAGNRFPVIEGGAAKLFRARQSKQGQRILNSLDDASGTSSLNIDDEIARLDAVLKPQINKLYNEAKSQNIPLSKRLQGLFDGDSSLAKARKKANQELIDVAAAKGEEIGNSSIEIIDATKQVLDDQISAAIRKGKNGKAFNLINLKNTMLKEADENVPRYREARDLYAGKKSLEAAGRMGEDFFKINAVDIPKLVRSMGESERNIFILGAKRAILKKADSLQDNANAVKRLFGKNGDTKKLRFLFRDPKDFKKFDDTLNRESQFILTRNSAQGNSTTKGQFDEGDNIELAFRTAIDAGAGSPVSIIRNLTSRLSGDKSQKQFTDALKDAGDILLTKGMEPGQISKLLRSEDDKAIIKALKKFINRNNVKGFEAARLSESTQEAFNDK